MALEGVGVLLRPVGSSSVKPPSALPVSRATISSTGYSSCSSGWAPGMNLVVLRESAYTPRPARGIRRTFLPFSSGNDLLGEPQEALLVPPTGLRTRGLAAPAFSIGRARLLPRSAAAPAATRSGAPRSPPASPPSPSQHVSLQLRAELVHLPGNVNLVLEHRDGIGACLAL